MTPATPTKLHKRRQGRERFAAELAAFAGFYAELYPAPLLTSYPMVDGVQARRRNVQRIAQYGRRFPR